MAGTSVGTNGSLTDRHRRETMMQASSPPWAGALTVEGDEVVNVPTAVVALGLSLTCALVGGVWLLWLRSKGTTWKDALHRRQIQGFNGLLLVGIGLVAALGAAVSLVPPLAPYRDAIMFVVTPIGLLALAMVLRKLLPLDGGAAAR